ncbi:hypothetical protein CORC01_11882 [Colletotrichum orchidophilum]|uniref:Uncharacterized protein n=1 Tax=Colletotrichum orchidophilum TaxID=1209926 RepID=A0A1G4AUI3_9PEZI|nr:uncharacterized protein CORC01_11882 [Colletotrichum orchidophilum]OHE92804.1 hypothetical protein CORC01_11882 [Colletotrichum orchidophilum]
MKKFTGVQKVVSIAHRHRVPAAPVRAVLRPPTKSKEAERGEAQEREAQEVGVPRGKAERKRPRFKDRIEEGLGRDAVGRDVKVYKKKKTVRTSAGELPISPIMDPEWMRARTKYRIPKPKPKSNTKPNPRGTNNYTEARPVKKYSTTLYWDPKARKTKIRVHKSQPNGGRFRVKLEQNPYAHALASPVRFCPVTAAVLPKYFLQNFKAVTNPETKDHWWMPGDVEVLWTQKQAMEASKKPGNVEDGSRKHHEEENGSKKHDEEEEGSVTASETTRPENPLVDPLSAQRETERLFQKAPSGYVVSRKPIIDSMSGKRGKTPFGDQWRTLLGRNQNVMNSDVPRRLVWREDMGDFVLENMRKNIMKYITYYVEMDEQKRSYIEPLKTWQDVHESEKRSCLLWHQGTDSSAWEERVKPFATYDVPDAKYEKSLPIYDLRRLLGVDYFAKLMEIPMFRDGSLFVVKKKRSIPLQLYLWKLEAYIAEHPSAKELAEKAESKQKADRERVEAERREKLEQEQIKLEDETREDYLRAKAEREQIIKQRIEQEMRDFDKPKGKTPKAKRKVKSATRSIIMPTATATPMTKADFTVQLMAKPQAESTPKSWCNSVIKSIAPRKLSKKANVDSQTTAITKAGSPPQPWGSSAIKPKATAKAINQAGSTTQFSAKSKLESIPKPASNTASTITNADAKIAAQPVAEAPKSKVKLMKPLW